MGQANRRLDDETKRSIKIAVWRTHSLLPDLPPSEYVDTLFGFVEAVFFLEASNIRPFIRGISPNIVVQGKCIIEVNNYLNANDRIRQYVSALSLAGALVHFQPNGLPRIHWYYLDLAGEVHVENIIEILNAEPVNVSVVQRQGETDNFAAGVGLGLRILGAVAAGVLAYKAVSGTKEEEEEEEEEEKEEEYRYSAQHAYDGNLESLMGKNLRKKYTFSEVLGIIKESAAKAKRNATPVYPYRDYRHNQYLNAFSSILHNELHSKGVPFEREKKIIYEGRLIIPDIYIKDIAVVEIKARNQLNSGGKEQVQKYVAATGLPGIFVNFNPNGDPYIRVFNVED